MGILIWMTETPRSHMYVDMANTECWLELHTADSVWSVVVGGAADVCYKWKPLETSTSIDDYPASYITSMQCSRLKKNSQG